MSTENGCTTLLARSRVLTIAPGLAAVLMLVAACVAVPPAGAPLSTQQPATHSSPSASAPAKDASIGPSSQPAPPSPDVPTRSPLPETIDRSSTGGILPPASIAVVLVDGLRIRDGHSLASPIVGSLDKGARLLVGGSPRIIGPISEDGQVWYFAAPSRDGSDREQPTGWVAAGDSAAPFLATLRPRCELATQVELTGYEQLACHGRNSFQVEGTYGCGECGGLDPGTFTPVWLAHPFTPGYPVLRPIPGQGLGRFTMHIPPNATFELPAGGSIVRVTGHFDDPAAATCRMKLGEEGAGPEVNRRAAVLYCREQFVIDRYETLGVDPDWPSG